MEIMELNENNFEHCVLHSEKPVLVDFYATWCGPCKSMTPVLEEFAQQEEMCQIGKVDIDKCPELTEEYSVMSVPTFFFFKNGKPEARVSGVLRKKELEEWIRRVEKNK